MKKEEDYMEKKFTKADLKDGMVGIGEDGEKYVWLCGKFRCEDGISFLCEPIALNDDLPNGHGNKELDIMGIFKSSANVLSEWFKDEYLTPIWTRPEEVTEMTISEIKTALGIAGTLKIKEDKQ